MPHKKQTAGIILAAGVSARYGKPKQLLRLRNKYLLKWVLDAALASRLAKLVLVLGYAHQKILRALRSEISLPRLHTAITPRYRQGQSRSLQAGLAAVRKEFESVMFLLGDQPLLQTATIDYLLEKFWQSEKDICVPVYRGKRGNPAIFSRALYGRLETIEGDVGARDIISANPAKVLLVEIDDELGFADIDSPEDFARLQSLVLKF